MAVVVGRVVDRLDVASSDGGDVAQRDGGLGAGNRDQDLFDFLHGLEPALGFEMISTSSKFRLPPGNRMFCSCSASADIGDIDAQLRNPGVAHLQIDTLILNTGQIDLHDPLQPD